MELILALGLALVVGFAIGALVTTLHYEKKNQLTYSVVCQNCGSKIELKEVGDMIDGICDRCKEDSQ